MARKSQLEQAIDRLDEEIDAIQATARTEVAVKEAAKRALVAQLEAQRAKRKPAVAFGAVAAGPAEPAK